MIDFSQADIFIWFVLDGLYCLMPFVVVGFVLSAFKGLFYGGY